MSVGPDVSVLKASLTQSWAVALYELRRLARGRHAIARFGVLAVPWLIAIIVAAVRISIGERTGSGDVSMFGRTITAEGETRVLATLFRFGHLRWIIFLSAAGVFGGLFSAERAERTLHHVFLQPVRREIVAFGKYAGAVMLLTIGALTAWILATVTWLLPHGVGTAAATLLSLRALGDLAMYAVVILLAAVAYGGIFQLAGTLVRSPAMVALALLAWEGLCTFLPTGFKRFTVFYWLDSLMPVRVDAGSPLAVLGEPAPWPLAILACLVIGAAGAALAAWRVRTLEVAYGASE